MPHYTPPSRIELPVSDSGVSTAVILGASRLQVPLIRIAQSLGYRVLVVDRDTTAPGVAIADDFCHASTLDEDAVEQAVRSSHAALLTTAATDAPMRVIARVSQRCGLSAIAPHAALTATTKHLMMQALDRAGVPLPRFTVLSSPDDLAQAWEDISIHGARPIILKPVDRSGSRGVVAVVTASALSQAYEYCRSVSADDTVLMCELMEGPEVSAEICVIDGSPHVVTITDKLTSGSPHFVELGHCQPSRLSPALQEAITQVACSAVTALGIMQGPAHVEIIVDAHTTPKIVEVGPRLGGDYITSHLVPASTGVDLLAATIKAAAGAPVTLERGTSRGVAIRFFTAAPGVVTAISLPSARDFPDAQWDLYVGVGDDVSALRASTDRLGHVICVAPTADEALAQCDAFMAATRITTTSLHPQ